MNTTVIVNVTCKNRVTGYLLPHPLEPNVPGLLLRAEHAFVPS